MSIQIFSDFFFRVADRPVGRHPRWRFLLRRLHDGLARVRQAHRGQRQGADRRRGGQATARESAKGSVFFA